MNRALIAIAAAAALASGSALACNDMKITGGDDGGVIASHSHAPATAVASSEKVAEAPLVVKQKQPVAKKTSTSSKPLPQGAVVARTGS